MRNVDRTDIYIYIIYIYIHIYRIFSPVVRLGGLAPARPITSAMLSILGRAGATLYELQAQSVYLMLYATHFGRAGATPLVLAQKPHALPCVL